MTKKVTLASRRLREMMTKNSIDGRELSKRSGVKYDDITNILAGKSKNTDKLSAIAKYFGSTLSYFLGLDDQNQENLLNYNGELHCKTVKFVFEYCTKTKIHLTKGKMDELVNFIYPRLKNDDSDELIVTQVGALVDYFITNKIN